MGTTKTDQVRQAIRLAMLAEDNQVDLHLIGANLDCDICGEPEADQATLTDRDILAYHVHCLEDKP